MFKAAQFEGIAFELAKEKRLKTELTFIMSRLDQDAQRSIELLQEQGSGSCFTALPLGRLSYSLNKVEFRDSGMASLILSNYQYLLLNLIEELMID